MVHANGTEKHCSVGWTPKVSRSGQERCSATCREGASWCQSPGGLWCIMCGGGGRYAIQAQGSLHLISSRHIGHWNMLWQEWSLDRSATGMKSGSLAISIVNSQLSWTCHCCMLEILPINTHFSVPKNTKAVNSYEARFHVNCHCCNGNSYSPNNVIKCSWCDNKVHLKSHRPELGCIICCENLIPAHKITLHELNND
jgi:hypothetical protein